MSMTKKNASVAKISRPRLTSVFPRKRLFTLLDTGRNSQVIWIAGQPGAGKTTLAASYLDARKLPYLWYQVDEGDADVATFFRYMGIATKMAVPGKQKPLPLLTPEYFHTISLFTKRYFEELFSRVKPPYVIVFDNYQEVPVNSIFHTMIIQGIEAIPEGITIMVISRNEAPPPFARLHANNRMHLLGWNEIKFTVEETKEIAQMKTQKRLPDKAIRELHAKTGGWAAGLILMMESTKIKDIGCQLPNGLTNRKIFDYFAAEIFEKTDKETHAFLLKTAFLPKMTVQTAEKVTGIDISGKILSSLNRNNFFTAMYQESEPVYQYHPLFREFLLSVAKDSFGREELSVIQRNAAALLEESGQVEDAVALLRDMKDSQGVARLILSHAPTLIGQGRNKTLEEWFSCIPGEIMENTPWLMYWLGVCRLPFNPSASHHLLENAFELFRIQNDRTGMLLSWAGGLDASFHEYENLTPLDRYASLWEDFFQEGSTFPSLAIEIRVLSSRFILMLLRQMNHPEIEKLAERLFSLYRECRDVNHRLQIGPHMAAYYLWTGDFANAGIVIKLLNKDVQSETASPVHLLFGMTGQAMYAWLTGSITSCLHVVHEALRYSRETGVHVWDYHLLAHGICASLSAGDMKTAAELLQKFESGLIHARKIDIGFYHFLASWNALLRGDLLSAAKFNEIALKAVMEVNTHFPIASVRYWEAQVLFELGKHTEAEAQLHLCRELGRHIKSKQIEYWYLLADAQFALGIRAAKPDTKGGENGQSSLTAIESRSKESEKRGLDALRKAMKLGREQSYVNMFGWRSDIMPRLCVEALEAGIEVAYVQDLIRKRQIIPDVPPLECENWPWPLRIFTLGQFVLLKEGEPIRFSGKVQHKPMELLKAIILFGGREVSEDLLVDVLWPDAEGDMAHQSFDTTLYRLRRLIGNDMAIQLHGGSLTLDDRYCCVDTWIFERVFERFEVSFKKIGASEKGETLGTSFTDTSILRGNPSQTEAMRLAGKAISIYKGAFLPSDTRYL